jgi:hypothetical protein
VNTLLRVFVAVIIAVAAALWSAAPSEAQPTCGNGRIDGAEECDNGANNSDSTPNACRTSCMLPRCGDAVIDSGEQCDDGEHAGGAYRYGRYNADAIPGACRLNCQAARCGDGVVDFPNGEECDNGVNDGRRGCFQCRQCYGVFDGQQIAEWNGYVRLCAGEYTLTDPGRDGVIQVGGDNTVIDCNGAVIRGQPPTTMQQIRRPTRTPATRPGAQPAADPRSQPAQPTQTTRRPVQLGQTAYAPGAAIVVNGTNITLVNCRVEGFATGIELRGSGNVVTGAYLCGVGQAMTTAPGNFGARNTCNGAIVNWQENGTSCTRTCP